MKLKPRGNMANPTLDELMYMDYMGSAEFEFGALPTSLKRMTTSVDSLEVAEVCGVKLQDGRGLFMLALPERAGVQKFLRLMAEDKHFMTKERTHMLAIVTGKDFLGKEVTPKSSCWVDAWWDIDNDVVWCFGKSLAEALLEAVRSTRDKKRGAGAEGWF